MNLYHKNISILEFDPNTYEAEILDIRFLPKQLLRNPDNLGLFRWLIDRVFDLSISSNRVLMQSLDLKEKIDVCMYANAMCMSDHFWINHTANSYEEHIRFKSGETPISTMTAIGSFEKRWKANKMYKRGNYLNNCAEVWNMKLCKLLELPTAEYFIAENEVVSPNFTDETNWLEHYASFGGSKDIFKAIFTVDAITSNPDRHEYNFGVLRCSDTGKVLGPAPNYDNNLGWGASQRLGTSMLNLEWDDLCKDILKKFAQLSLPNDEFPEALNEVQEYVRKRLG